MFASKKELSAPMTFEIQMEMVKFETYYFSNILVFQRIDRLESGCKGRVD